MTREEAVALLERYSNYEGLGIPNLAGCKEAMKVAAEALKEAYPELAESEDEKIRRWLCDYFSSIDKAWIHKDITCIDILRWLEKQKEHSMSAEEVLTRAGLKPYKDGNQWCILAGDNIQEGICGFGDTIDEALYQFLLEVLEKQKEQKTIEMEVYEVGKGTTICGQDYRCKKDYKEGNCRYIKDAIYHCGRDGYLTDQNGVSWSCTPEWFNEYIQSNTEWAEEEKTRFVSGQFLQCKLSFEGFKEGEHYWLEYVGDDMYVGRSDNILNQKFHITPRQLYTLFSQQLEEVQGPSQEEKQVSLNYEPPFNENPSDKEIIEALIKHLKEQDGFLTAINCVSTKAILSWLKKQQEQKPAEWSEEDEEKLNNISEIIEHCTTIPYSGGTLTLNKEYKKELQCFIKSLRPSWKPSEEQMKALSDACCIAFEEERDFHPSLSRLYHDLRKL